MQKLIRIHDKVNQYKGSCSLPIEEINHISNSSNIIYCMITKDNEEYVKNCISRLINIKFHNVSKGLNMFSFCLEDYHFTVYID